MFSLAVWNLVSWLISNDGDGLAFHPIKSGALDSIIRVSLNQNLIQQVNLCKSGTVMQTLFIALGCQLSDQFEGRAT